MTHQTNPQTSPLWADMTPEDFGEEPTTVQGALFAEPDPTGTLDLFDSVEE